VLLDMNPSKVFLSNMHLGVLALTLGPLSAQGCALTSVSPLLPADKSVETTPPQQSVSPQTEVSEAPPVKPAAKPKPVNIGEASWYGPGFTGKKTASGEIFDDGKFTAAHKTLPLGSAAKVTNLSNGKSVKVEINDRGPYAGKRIIDLSRAAAHAIGMIDDGVVQVRIDPLTKNGWVEADNVD
ncbi:MAG: septal ring lytic transglycosylase RlpA family protein, partial [Candidatus Binatia bacterium]